MKVRNLASGIVVERQPPDARDLVAAGGYEFVSRDTTSIVDALNALNEKQLRELFAQVSRYFGAGADMEHMRKSLIPLIEDGSVVLPEV